MSENLDAVPLPDLEDDLFAPYWQGTRDGRLSVQRCMDCGTKRWPPRELCWACGSPEVDWTEVAQTGKLYSWTVVGRATSRAYPDVPYTVGIVEIENSPVIRMIGVVRVDPPHLEAGLALKARFVPAGPAGEITLVQWEASGSSPGSSDDALAAVDVDRLAGDVPRLG